MHPWSILLFGIGALLMSCAPEPSSGARVQTALIDHDLWFPVESELTHLFPPKTEDHSCEEEGYLAEFLGGSYVFSVLTAFCDYIIVRQETLTDILPCLFPDAHYHDSLPQQLRVI